MERVNLTALWLWPLLALFVLLLMSVDNPFRLAVAALMLAAQKPLRHWILTFDFSDAAKLRFHAKVLAVRAR